MKNDVNKIAITEEQLDEIRKMVSSIKYGSVTLIIQDGVLLQIEKNEKIRLK